MKENVQFFYLHNVLKKYVVISNFKRLSRHPFFNYFSFFLYIYLYKSNALPFSNNKVSDRKKNKNKALNFVPALPDIYV